jgi:hypothetical protein
MINCCVLAYIIKPRIPFLSKNSRLSFGVFEWRDISECDVGLKSLRATRNICLINDTWNVWLPYRTFVFRTWKYQNILHISVVEFILWCWPRWKIIFKPISNFYAYVRKLKIYRIIILCFVYVGVESVSHMEGGVYVHFHCWRIGCWRRHLGLEWLAAPWSK